MVQQWAKRMSGSGQPHAGTRPAPGTFGTGSAANQNERRLRASEDQRQWLESRLVRGVQPRCVLNLRPNHRSPRESLKRAERLMMSHGHGWRDSCVSTSRDSCGRWLHRLVRPGGKTSRFQHESSRSHSVMDLFCAKTNRTQELNALRVDTESAST